MSEGLAPCPYKVCIHLGEEAKTCHLHVTSELSNIALIQQIIHHSSSNLKLFAFEALWSSTTSSLAVFLLTLPHLEITLLRHLQARRSGHASGDGLRLAFKCTMHGALDFVDHHFDNRSTIVTRV